LSNVWHLFEWISIFLILCCIGTDIADIFDHSEQIARLNIQITSFTIIILSLRLFKTCRTVLKRLGTLVMTLFYSLSDIGIAFIFYVVLWLSYCQLNIFLLKVHLIFCYSLACAFWIIYGGSKFDMESAMNPLCKDVSDTISNSINNCTVLEVQNFNSFNKVAYVYFLATWQPVDEVG